MLRLIVASNESGTKEEVIFSTDNGNAPAVDFVSPGLSIDIDAQIEKLPNGFPLDYILTRS